MNSLERCCAFFVFIVSVCTLLKAISDHPLHFSPLSPSPSHQHGSSIRCCHQIHGPKGSLGVVFDPAPNYPATDHVNCGFGGRGDTPDSSQGSINGRPMDGYDTRMEVTRYIQTRSFHNVLEA